jgi:hypothetical protein
VGDMIGGFSLLLDMMLRINFCLFVFGLVEKKIIKLGMIYEMVEVGSD